MQQEDQNNLLNFVRTHCGESSRAVFIMSLDGNGQLVSFAAGDHKNAINISFMSKFLDTYAVKMIMGSVYDIPTPTSPKPNLAVVKEDTQDGKD